MIGDKGNSEMVRIKIEMENSHRQGHSKRQTQAGKQTEKSSLRLCVRAEKRTVDRSGEKRGRHIPTEMWLNSSLPSLASSRFF